LTSIKVSDFDIEKDNFINSNGILTINHYKTSGSNGPYQLKLPQSLLQFINSYQALYNQLDSSPTLKYLFPNLKTNNPLTSRGAWTIIQRATDRPELTSSQLRSLYITEVAPTLDTESRNLLSKAMGHTLQTQVMLYQRYNKKIDPPTINP
jgi:hypothetical protein